MNYKYTHPLFDKDDDELAMNYLADRIVQDQLPDEESITEDMLKIIYSDIRDQIRMGFGINSVLMGNFYMVQDTFRNIYKDHFLSYLDKSDKCIDANIMEITPSVFTMPYINYIKKGTFSRKVFVRWDPSTPWTSFRNGDDPEENLLNPVNGLNHLFLTMAFEKEIPELILFKDYLNKNNITYYFTDNDDPVEHIRIQMLPTSSYNRIVTILKGIHAYF